MCCWALFSLFSLGTELEPDVGGCVRLLEAAAAAAALAGRDKLGGKEFWAVSEKSPRCMFGPHTSPVSATERETQSVVLGFSILHYSVLLKFLIKKVFPCQKFKEGKKIIWSLTLSLTNHFFLFFEFSQELFSHQVFEKCYLFWFLHLVSYWLLLFVL